MSNKRMLVGMVVALAVTFGYFLTLSYLRTKYPQYFTQPTPPATQPATPDAPPPATQADAGPDAEVEVEAATVPAATLPAGALRAVAAPESQAATLGSVTRRDPTYAMGLSLMPRGAGIATIVLNSFRAEAKEEAPYQFQTPYPIAADLSAPLATRSITIDGQNVSLLGEDWTLEHADDTSATYAIEIAGQSGNLLRVRKKFTIHPRTHAGGGYEVDLVLSFENLTGAGLKIKTELNGPTTPPRELDHGPDRAVLTAYDEGGTVSLTHHYAEQFHGDAAVQDLTRSDDDEPLLWFGTSSAYFNAIVRPVPPQGSAGASPAYIARVEGRALNPDSRTTDRLVQVVFETTELTLDAQQTLELPLRLYLGPKERRLLNQPYFANYPLHYNSTLITPGGCGTFCTFQWLVDLLVWMLNGFHFVVRDWGVAIIILVLIVRAILHPLTKKSQVSMVRMGKLGPEMERLKKKYGDNKEELNRAMMEFYKEQGFTPLLGCLPMFLQMPIWIALWQALSGTFELRHAPFLYGLTWINDLSKPDHLIDFDQTFSILFIQISGVNLLPILLAVVFWLQQKYTPKPPTTTPEQAQQQKMMQWMVLLFPLFLYSGPSGLNLYILASTAFGIIESKVIRDHIKQREALEAARGPVIVDAKPDDDRPPTGKVRRKEPPQKPGGLMGWFHELQRKAEEMREQQNKRK
jgi:YidC/Oxa1 family membrane protein insertase